MSNKINRYAQTVSFPSPSSQVKKEDIAASPIDSNTFLPKFPFNLGNFAIESEIARGGTERVNSNETLLFMKPRISL